MPKGIPKTTYSREYKQEVIERMRRENLNQCETARLYGIARKQVQDWVPSSILRKLVFSCLVENS